MRIPMPRVQFGAHVRPPVVAFPRRPRAKALDDLARRRGSGARLFALLHDKPTETIAACGLLVASLGAVITGLGFVTLRAREALLGLSRGLTYPKQEWLLTGLDTVSSLLWRGVSVLLTSDHPVLKGSAWALAALLVAVILSARSHRRPAILLAALGLSACVLAVGSGFYRFALDATASPEEGASRSFH